MKLRQLLSLSAAVVLFSACGGGLDEAPPSEPEGAPNESGEVSAFICPPTNKSCTPWEYQYDTGCGSVYKRTCERTTYTTGCVEVVTTFTQQKCE
ncbi:hypothetical protein [Pyxidicoccus xibeiensis]|uniref:hypothetical protein n=1 Tax=Pyxidicoccus xibeiensis TaxID=2906759 RepID=UPI0020A7DFCE|nr:hypothetical protein [Pyxidicoccus xibeiensis]MCP3138696.1 hypothetical protein [Pyxidicoccus xibeiensis]